MSRSRSRSPDRRNNSYSRSRSASSRGSRDARKRYSRSPSPSDSRKRRVSNGDVPRPNKCLGVFGLSLSTTERDLRNVFKKFGEIDNINIVFDRRSGVSRGFGFVYYTELESATAAKDETCGLELDGRRIRVDYSITERPHTPTPGIYMGKPTIPRDGGRNRSRGRSYSRSRSRSPYRKRRDYSSSRRRHYSPSRSRSRSPRRRYNSSRNRY